MRITQRAYAACVADFEPCLKALMDQVSGLDCERSNCEWGRIKYLMADEFTTTKGLGWIDAGRMQRDYELVQTYLGMEKPFPVESAFTTRLLDPAIKMDASKVGKPFALNDVGIVRSMRRRPIPGSHRSSAHRRRTHPWS